MLIITARGGFVNSFFKKKTAGRPPGEDGKKTAAEERLWMPREERCSLCRGELYPGDPYFALEGKLVCEDCLGRYARGYFAHRLRRVGERDGAGRISF